MSDAIGAVSETLDEITHQCWQATLTICGKNLPLLLAVTTAMHEIARVNNTSRIVNIITTARHENAPSENGGAA